MGKRQNQESFPTIEKDNNMRHLQHQKNIEAKGLSNSRKKTKARGLFNSRQKLKQEESPAAAREVKQEAKKIKAIPSAPTTFYTYHTFKNYEKKPVDSHGYKYTDSSNKRRKSSPSTKKVFKAP